MEVVYAGLLLHAAGQKITEENLTKVLQAAGITPEEGKVKALIASLEGQNIDEIIKQAVVVSAPAAEEKKEEKKKEEKPKEAAEGLSLLFSA